MATKDTVVAVVGATGNTGRRIVEGLLAKGVSVTAIGRNESRLKRLVDLGARAAVADVEDKKSISQAVAGATAVYALTPPNFVTDDFLAYQMRAGKAIADALEENHIRYVVHLSSVGADLERGNGPVRGLHFQELRLNDLDANVLHLRPAFFMENNLSNIGTIKNLGIFGTPLRSDTKLPMIATQDIASAAVQRLLKLEFQGKQVQNLLGTRDYTGKEMASILGKAIDRPELKYVQFSYEEAEKGLVDAGVRQDMARLYVEMYRGFNEGLIKPSKPRDAASTTPTTFEEFASTIFAPAYSRS